MIPDQAAHLVQVLGARGVQEGPGVQEEEALEEAVVQGVEERGGEADGRQRSTASSVRPGLHQGEAGAEGEEDVADLADAAEGEEALGLILPQRLAWCR